MPQSLVSFLLLAALAHVQMLEDVDFTVDAAASNEFAFDRIDVDRRHSAFAESDLLLEKLLLLPVPEPQVALVVNRHEVMATAGRFVEFCRVHRNTGPHFFLLLFLVVLTDSDFRLGHVCLTFLAIEPKHLFLA